MADWLHGTNAALLGVALIYLTWAVAATAAALLKNGRLIREAANEVSHSFTLLAVESRQAARKPDEIVEVPLHGRIAAGIPIEALEGASMLPVPAVLLGSGEYYALEVAGDSMAEAGILDGDYALIRKTDTARDGDIVIALIDEAEATLKFFRREGPMVRLDPANRHYDPQRYHPEQVRVQGKLTGLLRRY